MKTWKLKKWLHVAALGTCLFPWTMSHAAEQQLLWGNVSNYAPLLKNFSFAQTARIPVGLKLPQNMSAAKNSVNNFQYLSGFVDDSKKSHVRYDQYYQGLPVWQQQVIYHISSQNKTAVTGYVLNGIEKDVTDLNGKISLDQAKKIAIGKNAVPKNIFSEKIIFFDKENSSKALLAYHISYANRTPDGTTIPSYIIDANSGKILKEWNALPTMQDFVGQGPGGTDLDKGEYKYQFGNSMPGLNGLRKIGLLIQNTVCFISNPAFRVINLKNVDEPNLGFTLPISTADETAHEIQPFVFICSAPNYVNPNDNGFAPINHGQSPVNDAAYFVRQTINMWLKYNITKPVGTDLPVRVMTHLGNYDNAWACGTNCMKMTGVVGNQQLVFGNGQNMFAALTEGDVVSHEFGHLFTDHHANLTYQDQSGGLNEAFSDITGLALDNYERTVLGFNWYTNGADWTIGRAISLTNTPLRSMKDPHMDGHSIANASEFVPGMNPHYSSGVFNHMFYLLNNSPNKDWTIQMAYQVMLDANMKYWTPGSNFRDAGCGVLSAAEDRKYPIASLTSALNQVGVVCPVSHEKIMEVVS